MKPEKCVKLIQYNMLKQYNIFVLKRTNGTINSTNKQIHDIFKNIIAILTPNGQFIMIKFN